MIDFHCHLDLYPNPLQIIRECEARSLYVLSVTTTPSAWEGTEALVANAKRIRSALGLHPHLAHERRGELELFDRLLSRTGYVGEIGLDGAPEFRPYWKDQLTVFDHVLSACAVAGGRVLSIHSRRASRAVLDRLEAFPGAGTPVLHWFSGSSSDLERAKEIGCWFSVGPAMLAGERGRALAARMPRDRILTESDGPFARLEGRSITPWDIDVAIEALARIWGEPHSAAAELIHANFSEMTSGVGR